MSVRWPAGDAAVDAQRTDADRDRVLACPTGAAGRTYAPCVTEALRYRWTAREFLRAWEAGAFEERVELVDGEVWPVPIGVWHGDTTARILRALPNDRFVVSTSSLPTGGSVPDPDCWVREAGADPVGSPSPRSAAWRPADVLLVVEVADETLDADLGVKARLYGASGYPVYWVVTRDGIVEHTEPTLLGYGTVRTYGREDDVPVRHAGSSLGVGDLLAPTS